MARIRKAVSSGVHSASRKTVWLIAAYIRLSREDGNNESLSVTNQKKIIGEYLETFFEGEFTLVDYYIEIKPAYLIQKAETEYPRRSSNKGFSAQRAWPGAFFFLWQSVFLKHQELEVIPLRKQFEPHGMSDLNHSRKNQNVIKNQIILFFA